ncbi:MAG: hypothetical protein V4556_00720, partial [Bacteroidota bacterium]
METIFNPWHPNRCCSKIPDRKKHSPSGIKRFLSLFILSVFTFTLSFGQDVDFRQSANDDAGYGLGSIHWLNSILQDNNSKYTEGMSTLQRIVFLNIPSTTGNVHKLIFDFQTVKSAAGAHAYDFLTSWEQAVAAADAINGPGLMVNLNVCGAEPGSDPTGYLTACDAAHAGFSATASYSDNMGDPPGTPFVGSNVDAKIAAYESVFGDRTIKLWGTSAISNVSLRQVGDGCPGKFPLGYQTGSDADFRYELTWTSAAPTIVIEYGGHLAVGRDPLDAGIGYGFQKGAGNIPGGPYHTHLRTLDCASLGSQDNQITAADVIIPPQCDMTGPTCFSNNQTLQYSALINTDEGAISSYTWEFVTNTANAVFSGTTTGSLPETATQTSININVVPGVGGYTPGGTFTLKITVVRDGITHVCYLNSDESPGDIVGGVSVTATSDQYLINVLSADHSANLGVNVSPGSTSDYTYAWSILTPGSEGSLSATNISNPVYTRNVQGVDTIKVVITSIDGGCTAEDTLIINTSGGFPPCTQDPKTMCSGVQTTFTVDGPVNPDPANINYSWSIIPASAGTINGSSTGEDVSVTSSSTANFTVRLTMTAPAIQISINCNYPVTVVTAPTVVVTAPARCSNGAASTISVTPTGASNYDWTVPDGATDPGSVSSFQATVGGVYSVSVTLANGCSASNSATLIVNDPPTVVVTAPARCSNGAASTVSVTPTGASNYDWTVPDGA